MGALIMTHSDDNGLILPPKLAPYQVVIVPIYKGQEQLDEISVVAEKLMQELRDNGVTVKYDNRDTHKPGWKFNQYELQGVPVRIAIGPKDLEKGTVEVARRDTLTKSFMQQSEVSTAIPVLLDEIQVELFEKALKFRDDHSQTVDTWEEFEILMKNNPGFVHAHWDGTQETEDKIKELTKATIRCIPLNNKLEEGKCILTGQPSIQRVVFAKAY
jgi:prolyl-tRNA synthetase